VVVRRKTPIGSWTSVEKCKSSRHINRNNFHKTSRIDGMDFHLSCYKHKLCGEVCSTLYIVSPRLLQRNTLCLTSLLVVYQLTLPLYVYWTVHPDWINIATGTRRPRRRSAEESDLLPQKYTQVLQPFEAEACLNVIQEFSPYLKENTTLHHYKDQLVNAV
jgi:hypothetical protein